MSEQRDLLTHLDELEAKLHVGGCPECGRVMDDETALMLIAKLRDAVNLENDIWADWFDEYHGTSKEDEYTARHDALRTIAIP